MPEGGSRNRGRPTKTFKEDLTEMEMIRNDAKQLQNIVQMAKACRPIFRKDQEPNQTKQGTNF